MDSKELYYAGNFQRTCNIENQSIDNHGYIITPARDATVKTFNIRNNKNVKFIPDNVGDTFPQLIAFQIWNCSLEVVEGFPFKSMHELQLLNLGSNHIVYIESGAFDQLIKLERIQLNNNKIEHLMLQTFIGLSNLEHLYLNKNQIRFLNEQIFESLVSLRSIYLSNNRLETIPEHLFNENKKLENIWLDGNNIKHISSRSFVGKDNLKQIDLRSNKCVSSYYSADTLEKMQKHLEVRCLPLLERLLEMDSLLRNVTEEANQKDSRIRHLMKLVTQRDGSLHHTLGQLNICKANLTKINRKLN
jgi:Leucine rich repeat